MQTPSPPTHTFVYPVNKELLFVLPLFVLERSPHWFGTWKGSRDVPTLLELNPFCLSPWFEWADIPSKHPVYKLLHLRIYHCPPMWTPCVGTLARDDRSCAQQWRTNMFGGPSSDARHRQNEWIVWMNLTTASKTHFPTADLYPTRYMF